MIFIKKNNSLKLINCGVYLCSLDDKKNYALYENLLKVGAIRYFHFRAQNTHKVLIVRLKMQYTSITSH